MDRRIGGANRTKPNPAGAEAILLNLRYSSRFPYARSTLATRTW